MNSAFRRWPKPANGLSRIASSAGITCIYLSQKLAEIDDPAKPE